ncbi:MAG: SDR family oxidoreductase [Acidimicrobiia bacterium]|nr:SDR family oxidoreductase [Acidimicrobiia bacterium]
MELSGKVVVVTGAGNGIGRALARRFSAEGAAAVAVADLDGSAAAEVAKALTADGATATDHQVDVAVEADVVSLVEATVAAHGPIDLFCSNAGIAIGGGAEASDEDWQRIWDVNLMAHVYAARAVLPAMLARGGGYLLQTASAAGLLTNIGAAPYAVTKHAAVAFAEWLAITHGDDGIMVSCLCPQGVRTNMLFDSEGDPAANSVLASADALEPEEVAQAVVEGLAAERFLILPHPEVADYWRRKTADPDRWLAGMRRLQARVRAMS